MPLRLARKTLVFLTLGEWVIYGIVYSDKKYYLLIMRYQHVDIRKT